MLLKLGYYFGINTDNTLKIQLSRDEIASMIGTATESCIRLLFEFSKAGLIELVEKKSSFSTVKNFHALVSKIAFRCFVKSNI
jgi:hypothetical protein